MLSHSIQPNPSEAGGQGIKAEMPNIFPPTEEGNIGTILNLYDDSITDEDMHALLGSFEESSETPEDEPESGCTSKLTCRILLGLGLASINGCDTADLAMSLWSGNQTHPLVISTACLAAFLYSLEIKGAGITEKVNITCSFIKMRAPLSDWPKLTSYQEKLALGLSFYPLVWAPISYGIQGYFFIDAIPKEHGFAEKVGPWWTMLSVLTAGVAGTTTFFSENAEIYETIRNHIADISPLTYENNYKQAFSMSLGCTFAFCKASQMLMQEYVAISRTFNATSMTGQLISAMPCVLNFAPNFYFSTIFFTNTLNEIFHCSKERTCSLKTAFTFSLSGAMSLYIAYLQTSLNESFFLDTVNDLGIDPNNILQASTVFAWSIFLLDSIERTASLYEPLSETVQTVSDKVSSVCQNIYSFFYPPKPDNDIESLVINASDEDIVNPSYW